MVLVFRSLTPAMVAPFILNQYNTQPLWVEEKETIDWVEGQETGAGFLAFISRA
jgi:hypothetical protein